MEQSKSIAKNLRDAFTPEAVKEVTDFFGDDHRTVQGREISGFVAQVLYGWWPCGCGNPECDLFQNPITYDYEPFPEASETDVNELLRQAREA